jgi:hypothetical protein
MYRLFSMYVRRTGHTMRAQYGLMGTNGCHQQTGVGLFTYPCLLSKLS